MLRLLRSERRTINSEVAIIQWLSTVLSQQKSEGVHQGATLQEKEQEQTEEGATGFGKNGERDVESVENDHKQPMDVAKGLSTTDNRERPRTRSSDTASQQDGQEDFNLGLLQLLPTIVHHTSSESLGTGCILWQPQSTKPIVCLPSSWTATQRSDVDFDLGKTIRGFSRFISPNSRFGYAGSILSCRHGDSPSLMDARISTSCHAEGCSTWSGAFHLMLEDILRDGEDMAVSLPYPALRKHYLHLSHHLDSITEPRLVFINGGEDSNLLIAPACEENGGYEDGEESGPEVNEEGDDDETDDTLQGGAQKSPCLRDEHDGDPTFSTKTNTVIGFRTWSNAIFGDPLIATVFSNGPSPAFLDGYSHQNTCPSPSTYCQTPTTSAEICLLLYQAYHATVAIVKEFYHPQKDSTIRELAARKKLNEVLLKLRDVEERNVDGERPEPVHRRPSGDMSPAKKLKILEKGREQKERIMEREGVGSSRRQAVEVAE